MIQKQAHLLRVFCTKRFAFAQQINTGDVSEHITRAIFSDKKAFLM